MARYGYCRACGETVWLTESGACPKGHAADQISGIAESGPPVSAPAPAGSGRKSKGLVIAAIVLVVLLVCCLVGGILTSIAVPVFNSASTEASERACFAQQRTMEGATMQWMAEAEGRSWGDMASYSDLVFALVPEYVAVEPTCNDGGSYEYDPTTGEVSCSVHGHY